MVRQQRAFCSALSASGGLPAARIRKPGKSSAASKSARNSSGACERA
jgi:hypothetical protein